MRRASNLLGEDLSSDCPQWHHENRAPCKERDPVPLNSLLHLLYHQRFSPSTTSHCHVLNQAKVNIYCIFPRPLLQCLLPANSWFQRDNFGASCLRHQDDPTDALDSAWWFGEGPALGGTSGRCMALVIKNGWDIPERWASKWKNHLWMRGFWGDGNRIYHSKKMETEWTYTVEMGYMMLYDFTCILCPTIVNGH